MWLMSRMYKRLQINLPAIVTINPNERGERSLLLKTVNVSASGSMFYSEQSFSPDTPVKVVFLLRQGHSQRLKIVFTGKVVRSELGQFAVAFDAVHPMIVPQAEATFKTVE